MKIGTDYQCFKATFTVHYRNYRELMLITGNYRAYQHFQMNFTVNYRKLPGFLTISNEIYRELPRITGVFNTIK